MLLPRKRFLGGSPAGPATARRRTPRRRREESTGAATRGARYNLRRMANRYFVAGLPPPGQARLDGAVAHHLASVLRARPGDLCTLGDGRGASATARVRRIGKGFVELDVDPPTQTAALPRRLHLAFAPPRLARADWLFEHGTEVGVAVFHPLWTRHSRPQGERQDRWQKVVAAAAGQCDRAHLPEIRPLREFDAFLADPTLPRARFLGSGDAAPFAPADAAADEVLVLVGPEGGLAPDELAAATASGFAPRRFGPHILRTETAALVAAALWLGTA